MDIPLNLYHIKMLNPPPFSCSTPHPLNLYHIKMLNPPPFKPLLHQDTQPPTLPLSMSLPCTMLSCSPMLVEVARASLSLIHAHSSSTSLKNCWSWCEASRRSFWFFKGTWSPVYRSTSTFCLCLMVRASKCSAATKSCACSESVSIWLWWPEMSISSRVKRF